MPSWLFLVYFEPKKAILAKHFQISLNLVLLNKLFFYNFIPYIYRFKACDYITVILWSSYHIKIHKTPSLYALFVLSYLTFLCMILFLENI